MKTRIMKVFGLMLLVIGMSGTATAAYWLTAVAPEIDSGSAAGALVLLSGSLLVVRSRRKK